MGEEADYLNSTVGVDYLFRQYITEGKCISCKNLSRKYNKLKCKINNERKCDDDTCGCWERKGS